MLLLLLLLTDRRTEFSSLDRDCILSSAVKTYRQVVNGNIT